MTHTIQARPSVRFECAREVRATCKRISKTTFGIPKESKLVLYKRVDATGTWVHVLTGAKSCVTATIRVDTSDSDLVLLTEMLLSFHYNRHRSQVGGLTHVLQRKVPDEP